MRPYTSSSGVRCVVDEGFPDSDIILLSDSRSREGEPGKRYMAVYAFGVNRSILKAASPVFRDMFADQTNSGNDIDMDVDSVVLRTFLSLLHSPSPPQIASWEAGKALLDISRLYQCDSVTPLILHALSAHDPDTARFETFTIACEMKHILAACRLLRGAWQGEQPEAMAGSSLLPYSWRIDEVARLSPQWLWALTCSVAWADKVFSGEGDKAKKREDYWVAVSGQFMARLNACEFWFPVPSSFIHRGD